MELGQIVHDFAAGMEAADRRRPQAASSSTAGRFYQPGIGPFREAEAVARTLDELRIIRGGVYAHAGKRRYPASRYECDLALGELPDWAVEVKMARLRRDNGGNEDTTTKKILSPYPDDRGAVTELLSDRDCPCVRPDHRSSAAQSAQTTGVRSRATAPRGGPSPRSGAGRRPPLRRAAE